MRETIFSFEGLSTYLSSITSSSRFLIKVSYSKVDNLDALTPSHFLLRYVITRVPDYKPKVTV